LRRVLAWPDLASLTPSGRANVYRGQCVIFFLVCLALAVNGALIGRPSGAIVPGAMALLAVALFFFWEASEKPTLMSRRFQFSLGRLLSSTALAACAASLCRLATDTQHDNMGANLGAMLACPIVVGATIGCLFGRAAWGAATVVIGYYLLIFIVCAGFLLFAVFQ
jgi:hypothetical protein